MVFEVECIDRMYCNVYVPQLQYAGGLLGYIQRQLGLPIASTAPLGKITDAFSTAMRRFARDQQVPWVDFTKGQRKDDVMHEHLARFTAGEGVLFIGRAQEKTGLFRTERRRDANGDSYPWIVKTTGMVNHFYVYAVDTDFGPFFLSGAVRDAHRGGSCPARARSSRTPPASAPTAAAGARWVVMAWAIGAAACSSRNPASTRSASRASPLPGRPLPQPGCCRVLRGSRRRCPARRRLRRGEEPGMPPLHGWRVLLLRSGWRRRCSGGAYHPA